MTPDKSCFHISDSMLKTINVRPDYFGLAADQMKQFDKYIELLDGKVLSASFFRVCVARSFWPQH